jgi:hypothetical protein
MVQSTTANWGLTRTPGDIKLALLRNWRIFIFVIQGGEMKQVAILALGALALYIAVVSAPDVARYIKITRM